MEWRQRPSNSGLECHMIQFHAESDIRIPGIWRLLSNVILCTSHSFRALPQPSLVIQLLCCPLSGFAKIVFSHDDQPWASEGLMELMIWNPQTMMTVINPETHGWRSSRVCGFSKIGSSMQMQSQHGRCQHCLSASGVHRSDKNVGS